MNRQSWKRIGGTLCEKRAESRVLAISTSLSRPSQQSCCIHYKNNNNNNIESPKHPVLLSYLLQESRKFPFLNCYPPSSFVQPPFATPAENHGNSLLRLLLNLISYRYPSHFQRLLILSPISLSAPPEKTTSPTSSTSNMTPSKTKKALPSSTSMAFPDQPTAYDQWKIALAHVKSLYLKGQWKQCAARCNQLLLEAKTPVSSNPQSRHHNLLY